MEITLYYIHDPMCSWCYAFQTSWSKIKFELSGELLIEGVIGGLAADSDQLMPASMQDYVQTQWHRIQQVVPGIEFNFDFWSSCKPRRSTYPACRAVIAAKNQGGEYEEAMIYGIQKAYYRQAKNPSNNEIHIQIAHDIDLEIKRFTMDLSSKETNIELQRQISFARGLGISGFPSLLLLIDGQYRSIPHDYNDPNSTLTIIDNLLRTKLKVI